MKRILGLLILAIPTLHAGAFETGQEVGRDIVGGTLGVVSGAVHEAGDVLSGDHHNHLRRHHNRHMVTEQQPSQDTHAVEVKKISKTYRQVK